jgi:hypothetical protein
MKLLISIFILLTTNALHSQESLEQKVLDSTNTKFYINQQFGVFEILLNDTIIIKHWRANLKPGAYKGQVWAPHYETSDISFVVEDGQETKVYVTLQKTTYLSEFESKLEEYYAKQRVLFSNPIVVSMFFTAASLTTYGIATKTKGRLKKIEDLYRVSTDPGEIFNLKNEYVRLSGVYDKQYRAQTILFGLTSVVYIISVKLILEFRKITKPHLKDINGLYSGQLYEFIWGDLKLKEKE